MKKANGEGREGEAQKAAKKRKQHVEYSVPRPLFFLLSFLQGVVLYLAFIGVQSILAR